MVLFGSSYVMILYSSEARGYALAAFSALAAFYLLDRYHETSAGRRPRGSRFASFSVSYRN